MFFLHRSSFIVTAHLLSFNTLLFIFTSLTHVTTNENWTYQLDQLLKSNDNLDGAIASVSIRSAQTRYSIDLPVKEMGKKIKGEGSWECGLEVVEEVLQKWKLQTDTFVLRDGSGISHVNALTTNELSKLLYKI